MEIPFESLDKETLQRVIEEIVTRSGTDLCDSEDKVEQVITLLKQKKAILTFDDETKSCSLVSTTTTPTSTI